MILRRFVRHVTDQNWFAVGLDVIVVIVGIFLGLQVQSWSEEQEERSKEYVFLSRMHSELMNVFDYEADQKEVRLSSDFLINIDQDLGETIDALGGINNIETLELRHCGAIFLSHAYATPIITLPSLTELLSSGQLSIIVSDNIKTAISEYLSSTQSISERVARYISSTVTMAEKYPELIEIDLAKGHMNLVTLGQHVCKFKEMAINTAFKNDLSGNYIQYRGFVSDVTTRLEKLQDVHNALDSELGIKHTE